MSPDLLAVVGVILPGGAILSARLVRLVFRPGILGRLRLSASGLLPLGIRRLPRQGARRQPQRRRVLPPRAKPRRGGWPGTASAHRCAAGTAPAL